MLNVTGPINSDHLPSRESFPEHARPRALRGRRTSDTVLRSGHRAEALRRAALAAMELLEPRQLLATVLPGTVFTDHNGDGHRGIIDFPVPGVRVYWDRFNFQGTDGAWDPGEAF